MGFFRSFRLLSIFPACSTLSGTGQGGATTSCKADGSRIYDILSVARRTTRCEPGLTGGGRHIEFCHLDSRAMWLLHTLEA